MKYTIKDWIEEDPRQFTICAMMAWGINPRMLTEDPEEVMRNERDNIEIGRKNDKEHKFSTQKRRSDDASYFADR